MAIGVYNLGYLSTDDIVKIDLTAQADVLLMDDTNYNWYTKGGRCDYYGGTQVETPGFISVPHSANWYIVVNGSPLIKCGVSTLKR